MNDGSRAVTISFGVDNTPRAKGSKTRRRTDTVFAEHTVG
jgi:hypothetical protein